MKLIMNIMFTIIVVLASGCIGFPVTRVSNVLETSLEQGVLKQSCYITRMLTVKTSEDGVLSKDEVCRYVVLPNDNDDGSRKKDMPKNTKVHIKSFDHHESFVPVVFPFVNVYFLSYNSYYQIRFSVDGEQNVEYIYNCDESDVSDLPMGIGTSFEDKHGDSKVLGIDNRAG